MKQRVGLAFTSLTSHEPGERHKRFAQPERDEEQQQSALRLALREEHPNTKRQSSSGGNKREWSRSQRRSKCHKCHEIPKWQGDN